MCQTPRVADKVMNYIKGKLLPKPLHGMKVFIRISKFLFCKVFGHDIAWASVWVYNEENEQAICTSTGTCVRCLGYQETRIVEI